MKKIFSITIILLFFNIQLKAQLDTMNYIKQFEANKANYIGQPFSKLLNDMTQIQPKTVWSLPIRNKLSMVKGTSFKFSNKKASFYNAITLKITWQNEIPHNETKALGTQNGYYFTNDERSFYGNRIVKDIMVYR